MNEIEAKLSQVKDALHQIPEIKEFFKLREEIIANQELAVLDEKIRLAQRGMGEHLNDEKYQTYREEYDALTSIYEAHPLIINYRQLKEAVTLILSQMKDILSLE